MAQLGPFAPGTKLLIAVSGGGDSMALAALTARWACDQGHTVGAAIVDHGLRPDSSTEAQLTRSRLMALGIDAVILPWLGTKPATRRQQAAREVRYRLLQAQMQATGALYLLAGHHADDQAETVLMRAHRHSGPAGLAGMPPRLTLAAGVLLRPLLDWPKAALLDYCRARGISWAEDPTNLNPTYWRGAHRLSSEPPPADWRERLAAARAGRAADEQARATELAANAWLSPLGVAHLTHSAAPLALRAAALAALIGWVSPAAYPPTAADIIQALQSSGDFTLGKCHIWPDQTGWWVAREPRDLPPLVAAPAAATVDGWDGRLSLHLAADHPGRTLLSYAGWHAAGGRAGTLPAAIAALPHRARLSLPVLDWGAEAPQWPDVAPPVGVAATGTGPNGTGNGGFTAVFTGRHPLSNGDFGPLAP